MSLKFLPFALLLAIPLSAQEAQNEVKRLAYSNPFTQSNQDAINMLNRTTDNDRVSFLLFDDWRPMESLGRDSTLLVVDSANYHIQLDQVIFMSEGKSYALFPERIFYAKLGENVLIHRPYAPEKRRTENHYFEVLTAGEYSLLCKYEIKREDKNDHPMGLPATRYTEYSKDKDYYYIRENARVPEPVPTKKKDFIMMFRRFRPEMVIYAKENRISLRDEADLKQIFTYYNNLISDQQQ